MKKLNFSLRSTSCLFLCWLLFCELILSAVQFHIVSLPSIENLKWLDIFDRVAIFSTLKASSVFDPEQAKRLLLFLVFLTPFLLYLQNRFINVTEFVRHETKSPKGNAVFRIIFGVIIIFVISILDWGTGYINRWLLPFPGGFAFLAALVTFFYCWYFLCAVKNFLFLLKQE